MEKVIKKCEFCNADVSVPITKLQETATSSWANTHYCNKHCREAHQETKRVYIICKQCGVRKKVPPHEFHRKFCSAKCRIDYQKQHGFKKPC